MTASRAGPVEFNGGRRVSRSAIGAWLMFDWAAQPHFTLITTFVFAPYFAAQIAETPVAGQAMWGYASGAAGLVIALLSPVLGAVADAAGARKPWIVAFSILLVVGTLSLWFAVPGAEYAVGIALVGFAIATIGAEFATVFTNAIMPDLVDESRLGRLSGTGWAVGFAGGLVSLVVVLGFLIANPASGLTLLGQVPILGLDPTEFEGERASGPFTAIWYAIFILPLFLLTPDRKRRNRIGEAVRTGLAELGSTLFALKRHANAAGIFGWKSFELGLFGILLTITGTIGALIGGRLDDRYGAKKVIVGALSLLTLASIAILSIDANHVGFIVEVAPINIGDGLFASTGERVYLALGGLIGALAGPLQAASRSLMARIAPAGQITEFFGLYALSGKVTSFAGPFLIGFVTAYSQSQRIGISMLVVFFVIGAVLLIGVKSARA